jgi:hypothetical protein
MAWSLRGKRGKGKKNLKRKVQQAAGTAVEGEAGSSSLRLAVEYLEQWTEQNEGRVSAWKFNKTRQSFLLRSWPSRDRLPSGAFQLLLGYLTKLPEGCRIRTIEQAQREAQVAEEGEKEAQVAAEAARARADEAGGEDVTLDEIEERIALFKIQRARALKVMQALTQADAAHP